MIPDIGILIAAYVVTRMLHLISTPLMRNAGTSTALQIVARVFAVVTILVAVVVGIDLALRGSTGVSLPELVE